MTSMLPKAILKVGLVIVHLDYRVKYLSIIRLFSFLCLTCYLLCIALCKKIKETFTDHLLPNTAVYSNQFL